MQLYLTNPRVILINRRLSGFFAITVVCILLLMTCAGISSDPNSRISSNESVADSNDAANDSNGPTIMLSYSKEMLKENPISSFMYFVPLISPTLVDRETSANNEQQVGIISYKRKVTSKSFYVTCEFEVLENGFHKNTFDSAEMIAAHTDELKKGESLTNMLDYIKIEGDGAGLIEVKGTITGSTQTVTEVDICFNARDQKSPVTIGLYDIKPKDGEYKYENRSNEVVARVNTLAFKKTQEPPKMGIEIASIHKKTEGEGFWSKIKGLIANFLIKPLEVTELGNDTMLNFGYTLLEQKPAFTFPKAKNIKENRLVAIDNIQE